MTQYNDVLNELQYYILNENNIAKFLELKIKTDKNTAGTTKLKNVYKSLNVFFPREKDTLFWCFYILKFGPTKYEMLYNRNEVVSRQIKIDYVEKIRKEKQLVKTHKFDTFSNIENNLANENMLNIKTFLTLCVIENINVLFVNGKCYYELITNDTDNLFIVYTNENNKNNKNNKNSNNINNSKNNNSKNNNSKNNNYYTRYGYKIDTINEAEIIRSTLYKLDNIDKPIKALSSYKISELIEICNKLSIETKNSDGKNKSKNDLYELIIQFF
jgi:hypothetical protein